MSERNKTSHDLETTRLDGFHLPPPEHTSGLVLSERGPEYRFRGQEDSERESEVSGVSVQPLM